MTTLSFAYQFVREPLVITLLALFAGISVGISHEQSRSGALWGSAGAVFLMSVCVFVLSPEATLAPSGCIVGFAATALLRDHLARRRRERDQES
ncbi:hypothetical protein SAMN04487848_0446 [Microbacterium sp. ru370.1]|uniref:hypothetical protein n=1 Tax=unclassified Microbacterium TaxID=2609290 RepID=UPI00087EFA02|nr:MULTISPECIES: hypothetical protein [unclassified Microbacterium]SDO33532.1 hypothetical protein SAMN04487848_0446 [Microbacterium sp. ru370.1]SIT77114.1 hypothetical protein SAMN05880579_0441 [Microbacterium sp. RU1D]